MDAKATASEGDRLTDDEIDWLIWSLGFVLGVTSERDRERPERREKIETRCLTLAEKLTALRK